MGRVITPTFRLETSWVSGARHTPQEWRKQSGRPTTANIDKWVAAVEQSMIDGPNKHLGIDQCVYARIIRQRTGEVVAEWERSKQRPNQPMFEIVESRMSSGSAMMDTLMGLRDYDLSERNRR